MSEIIERVAEAIGRKRGDFGFGDFTNWLGPESHND
jgi:hypothetical protein